MWNVLWQVKTTKFCGLRCRYCYEWDSLTRRKRISLDGWEKILVAVAHYHDLQTRRFGDPGQSFIVWHGGEPLSLPIRYWEEVFALSGRILGRAAPEFGHIVQTNLYALTPGMLELFQREKLSVSVSLDVVPGVRLDRRGRQTERQVEANLDRLQQRDVSVTGSVVLGAHTRDRLPEIHDFFAKRGIGFRLIPMFDSPAAPDSARLAIRHEEAAEALGNLFVHWMAAGCPMPIYNLIAYLDTVLLRLASLHRLAWDARQNGERAFVVDTDGTLWSLVERYRPAQSLGNLFVQPLDDILESRAYRTSVLRREILVRRHCQDCRYHGACDREPISAYHDEYPAGPCPIAARVCAFIEEYIRRSGYDERHVGESLSGSLLAAPLGRELGSR